MRTALILATNFFPFPGVGAVRVTNWARMLPALGWRPVVVCRDYAHHASRALLDTAISPHAVAVQLDRRGRRVPTPEADAASPPRPPSAPRRRTALASLKHAAAVQASQCIVPDAQRLFWSRALPEIRRVIDEHRPEVLISSSPPHSVHLAAMRLAREHDLPWIADYRDPHVIDARFRPRGPAALTLPAHRAFERRVYARADLILHAIPLQDRWARLAYPESRDKCRVLRHPVPADMGQPEGAIPGGAMGNPPVARGHAQDPTRRSIRLIGSFGPDEALTVARAVALLTTRDHDPLDLELRFVGPTPQRLPEMTALLGDRVAATGPLRHDLAKAQVAGADVLVNALSARRQGHLLVSSKLFEFAAAAKPIIEINPTVPDRQLLRRLGAAATLQSPTPAQVAAALEHALSPRAAADAATGPAAAAFRRDWGWQAHASRLADALDEAIARHAAG